MNTRYTLLPFVSMVLQLLAYLMFLAAIILGVKYLFLGTAIEGVWQGHIVPSVKVFLNLAIKGFILLAVSEGIHVLMDIEENTRRAADATEGRPAECTPDADR